DRRAIASCLMILYFLLFCTNPPSTEILSLSLHDALPISLRPGARPGRGRRRRGDPIGGPVAVSRGRAGQRRRPRPVPRRRVCRRSEEHTSELQSRENLLCRLLLDNKKFIR